MQTWVKIEKRNDAVIVQLAGGSVTVTKYGTNPATIRWAALSNPTIDDARTMAKWLIVATNLAEKLDVHVIELKDYANLEVNVYPYKTNRNMVDLTGQDFWVSGDLELYTEGFELEDDDCMDWHTEHHLLGRI
jgi:ribosomal protein L30E